MTFRLSNYPFVILAIIYTNEKEWLDNCLSSLLATDYPDFKIIAIDNASKDGSTQFIRDKFSGIEVIVNNRNIGFTRAVNMAINIAIERNAKYLVTLNPDIKVTADWLNELVKIAEKDEDVGIAMPLHHDYSGDFLDPNILKILEKNIQYLKDKDTGNLKEKYEVTSAIAGCMMIRMSIVEKIGFMDPIYFLYGEDSDLSRRMVFHGYKIVVAMKSRILHWHRILHKDKLSKGASYLLFRNQFIYFLKDPNSPFLHNLWRYYFDKKEGMWGMVKSWAPISVSNWRYLVLAFLVQFWIFILLPIIFIRQMRDRKKI